MKTSAYFNLAIPAPRRLAMLRDAFASHATRYPHCPDHVKPKTWRDIRGTTHGGLSAYVGALSQGQNGSNNPVWYTHTGEQFRGEKFCDESDAVSIDHTGWYCDAHGDEKARGIIARLPHGRFIAGYWLSVNGERVYFPEVYDDERDAALAADGHAESVAESEREYNEKYNEGQRLKEQTDEKVDRLRECLALRNNPRFDTRGEASELIAEIRANRERLETEYKDFI